MRKVNRSLLSWIILLILIISVLLAGCAGENRSQAPKMATEQASRTLKTDDTKSSSQKIIQTANMQLETSQLPEVEAKMLQIITDSQGEVSNSSVSRDSKDRLHGSYTLRVPQDKLLMVMDGIAKIPNVLIKQRNITKKDVTEEYIDTEARLDNMKRHENRLQEILAKANTVDEVLKVETELTKVRTQIESNTGRLKYLSSRVELSTLSIRISEAGQKYWSAYGEQIGKTVKESFIIAGDVFLGLIMIVIGGLPLVGLVGLLVVLWRKYKKRKQNMTPKL